MSNYAIGFLRPEVSGEAWHQDEARIHALAAEHGRSIILMYYGDAQRPGGAVINRLMNLTYAEHANEIIAPGAHHFEPGDIPALVKIADVICADTGMRYTIPRGDTHADSPQAIGIGDG
ncbi:hypothetical protein KHQ06_17200 [Nocardia tengchongensis]|uniref:Uncharacterized protein n=1 Tax=Nocardia tengchongensis TaxID=2055889 RepID=A0ABX8CZS4_9NOCA|nr:hypothetical protein [Nocardia tengchongensis]QVI24339.1 hypothetical protein KHQ06_17200 [Nocardia tengchongensis]